MKLRAAQQLNLLSVLMVAAVFASLGGKAWAQPELEVQKDGQSAYLDAPYRITCLVSWIGDANAYSILPPEVDPIDWGTVKLLPSQAFVRDGKNFVAQTIEITPTKSGEVKTPDILVPYLRPEDIKKPEKPDTPTHLIASDAPPKLRADPFPLLVQPHTTPAWLFGVLGALFVILLVVVWRVVARKRRSAVPPPSSPIIDLQAVRARVQAAKRHRMNGDFYGTYRELAGAATLMEPHAGELVAVLKGRADVAGYRGVRPTEDQMDGDIRDVERLLSQVEAGQES